MKIGFLLFTKIGLRITDKEICLFRNLYQKYKQESLVAEKIVVTVK